MTQEEYNKATVILLEIENVKQNIKDIEDDEFFNSGFAELVELCKANGMSEDDIKEYKEKMRKRALRTLRGTLINLEQKFKEL